MKTNKTGRLGFDRTGPRSPEVLTDAETIVFPVVDDAPASAVTTAPMPRVPERLPQRRPFEPFASSGPPAPALERAPAGLPVRARHAKARPALPGAPAADGGYTPTRRRTVVSRIALLAILVLQAVLTLRLRNTAFEDEALYLYAGRMEIAHLLHGAALQGSYASYFSGAPVLYPVLGAALNMVGGLALARALSLAEMLAVTAMLYSVARFMFNERVALCSAALFAVSESALFVGHLATYDATCLFLLAAAATIAVRTSAYRWPVFLLAAPLAALAVAVKYAGALYVPTICCLPALAGWPVRGRRVLWYPLAFGVVVAALLWAGLHLGGHAYLEAITSTTTNRAQGTTSDGLILRESVAWGGLLTVLAAIGAVAYARRPRTEPGELIGPPGQRARRVLLGIVLSGTMFLAPLYQMHLHTDVSLQKHIGFGMFFAAPLAGVGLVRIVGDHFRRPHLGIALWSAALALGISQSWSLYHDWPSSGPFVSALSPYLSRNASYLVEVPEVPIYYLEGLPGAQPGQFSSTYDIAYTDSQGQVLTGNAGFSAAVRAGAFKVIAYTDTVTPAADNAIQQAIEESRGYKLVKVVHLTDANGPLDYYVWLKRTPPPHPARARR
ncbi:MAG TPA: glycosyltransferase family 39 protein [Trebonia sp.]|nr:glycosyltransferase family 39 protein [Trebonia sp.]